MDKIFFSLAREKKTGRSRSKRKERFVSLVGNFGLVELSREVQIDLPLRRTPLPLLRCLEWAFDLIPLPLYGGLCGRGSVSACFIQSPLLQKRHDSRHAAFVLSD